jgi:hypothetical protein
MLDVVVEAGDACPVVEEGSRVALIKCLAFILGSVTFWVMEFLESNEAWGMHSCMESKDRQKDQAGPDYFILFLSFYIYLGYLRAGLNFSSCFTILIRTCSGIGTHT